MREVVKKIERHSATSSDPIVNENRGGTVQKSDPPQINYRAREKFRKRRMK